MISFSLVGKSAALSHSDNKLIVDVCPFTENLQKLVKPGKDDLGLGAINGIKALSMIFIIAGHALLFIVGGPVFNTDYYAKVCPFAFAIRR